MSQQQTSQSSGQGLLERVFKLREHGTTARTEAITSFLLTHRFSAWRVWIPAPFLSQPV